MMQHPRKIFSAQNLYESIWNEPYFYNCNSTVMVHIRKLRVKIEKNPQQPEFIKTVWGKGYKFELRNSKKNSIYFKLFKTTGVCRSPVRCFYILLNKVGGDMSLMFT